MIDIYIYTERERRGKTIKCKLREIHIVMKKIDIRQQEFHVFI